MKEEVMVHVIVVGIGGGVAYAMGIGGGWWSGLGVGGGM